jgi:hypothetical protein
MMRKNKEGAVYTWNEVVKKIKETDNEKAYIAAVKILGELYFEFKDHYHALKQFHEVKYRC